ncbi:dihydrolipoamide acetyltransferase component of pyruvate dehydrogenase complex [Nadsonia fulvescens var. elongata DSM 6958]|uniref:Acetyltransferase component of pyruvate dehydrogenase complex n=1 Tax=Nadsonia fulvescens var. elongata DSM 6958 TaxID=857566 RepID=A0A1E3PQC4_9ASCO|nr:dihydrolipoamide acetyltransferase component of pyruvate dehydrogenase complex [Nadsonia fulvescens var. elongata DSM 6958]
MSAIATFARVAPRAVLRLSGAPRVATPLFARLYASKTYPAHTIIGMPALSPTMTQGNVGTWHKAVGDSLTPGDVLVEIETDKAQMDFEFQDEGFLAKVILDAGAKDVLVNTPIGVFVENSEDVAAFADFVLEDSSAAAPAPAAEAKDEPAVAESTEAPKVSAPTSEAKKSDSATTGRINASPLAKQIALEKGIPLKDVKGSGPNGRIIKRDLDSYKAPAAAAPAAASGKAAAQPASADYEDIPLTMMRKTIAKRLVESKLTNPHYQVSSTVSVDKLMQLRAALNAVSEDKYRISVNDIFIKAMAAANKAVPAGNSAWLEAEGVVRQYKSVDVSVAVATPSGLITPVIKNADTKGLVAISTEVKKLGKLAKENKLTPDQYQGGTITISNLGMNSAVNSFTAIINPPQAAILAIGTLQKRAIEDAGSESGIAFETVITVTASFDHRVIDGAVGGEWIKAFKRVVENPLELML